MRHRLTFQLIGVGEDDVTDGEGVVAFSDEEGVG